MEHVVEQLSDHSPWARHGLSRRSFVCSFWTSFVRLYRFSTRLEIRLIVPDLVNFAKDIVAAAIAHARSGIDLYDIRSAGGFNQEELERLVSIMEPYVVELASTLTKA